MLRDAPGSEARCPGSSNTAAAGSGRKPTPLAGCRSPAAAGWSPRPPGSRHVPGRRHVNPSPTSRNDPAAPAARSSPGGQRARNPGPAAPLHSPPAPPLPTPYPGCHTRPGSAGLRHPRALSRPRVGAEAGRGQGRGQDAGPGRSARQAGRGRRWAEPAGGDVVLDLRSPDLKTLPFLP